ncbi:MAG: phage tail tape measure protein [Butyrivibrio sp.]|nr:phage tail tape measure protein [Butyrivibrio sp.]
MDLFTLVGKIVLESDEFNNKVDSAMSKVDSLANGFQKAGDKITQIGSGMTKAVTLPLAAVGTASVSTAATFEDAMLKVQSLSGATRDEYDQLTGAAKKYGSTTAWTAKDVADAMGYMALAGFDTKEILASVGGMLSLASASGEDLATVTDILTDSMTAFGDSAEDASRYADVLATTQAKSNTTVGQMGEAFKYVAPLAGAYGYQLEDVAAALGMMANAGVKSSMSGTALSSIITRLGTNTNGVRDAIEELGVEFYNSDGTARNLSDVLKDLCDATATMDTAQKAALASTVAGQEAQKGLLAILNQGSAAYEDLEGKIKSCSGTASDMAQNMESGLGGSLRSLKSALEGVSITIGEKLAPYIEKAAQKIKEFTQWFQNLDAGTQETIVKMGLLLASIGPVLTILGKGASAIGNIISVGSKLVGGIKTVVSVGSKLTGGIKTVVSVGSKLVSGAKLVIGALTSINPVVLAVVGAIGAVVGIGVALYKN